MIYSKTLIAVAVLAQAVMTTPAGPAASDGGRAGDLGVGISVDSRWITVEGYYSVCDRGADAREEAWAGGPAPRGATDNRPEADARSDRPVRVVRIAAVPNLVGRTRDNMIAMRALTHAALVIARHVVVATLGPTVMSIDGAHDADRR